MNVRTWLTRSEGQTILSVSWTDGKEPRTVYAIIRAGGKQYRVEPGEVVHLERLDAEVGSSVTLDDVLLVGGGEGVQVGAPRVENAAVVGTVVKQGRERKIRVFKHKRRKHYRRTKGHRQAFTAVKIERVEA
jgi:large subunit ribosomal protein L21